MALSAMAPKRVRSPSPPPLYNEHGVELQQPIEINPRTGKPKVKRQFARRYASLILAHVARENAATATREALEYRARKQRLLEMEQKASGPPPRDVSRMHGRKISVAAYFSQLLARASRDREKARLEEQARQDALLEEKIKAEVGEDPTQKALLAAEAAEMASGGARRPSIVPGDNATQIEALHRAGNIFNAILRADRKAVDALLRANPHVLSQRGPVGELPLHMAFLYNTPAHHVLAFYLMARCPHVILDPYLGTEYTGENILHIAIIQQEPRMVARLVAKEPKLLHARATGHFFQRGQPCYYGEYPLSFACCTGQLEIVEMLIGAGADLEAVDSNGNNVLHLMVVHGRTDMYDILARKWTLINERRSPADKCAADKVLWKRRNKEGFTPMTLSAKIGSLEMFSFLLESEKEKQWSYGPVSCYIYPLEQIDMPLALARTPEEKAHQRKQLAMAAGSPSPPPDHDDDDDDDDDTDDANVPRALELIVNEAHLDLLMHPRMIELIKQKWERFASRIFFRRFLTVLLYLALFTATTIHRQTENILSIARWDTFETNLHRYNNQAMHIQTLTHQRARTLNLVEAKAQAIFQARTKARDQALVQQGITGQVAGAGAGATLPDLHAIRSELLEQMSLDPLPTLVHLPHLDLSRLEKLVASENYSKLSSRAEAGLLAAHRRQRNRDEAAAAAEGESSSSDGDAAAPLNISLLSVDELELLLTPPAMLYGDGVLNGLWDLVVDLGSTGPREWWSGGLLSRHAVFLLLAEIVVVLGAMGKGANEIGEMRDRGINNYFGQRTKQQKHTHATHMHTKADQP